MIPVVGKMLEAAAPLIDREPVVSVMKRVEEVQSFVRAGRRYLMLVVEERSFGMEERRLKRLEERERRFAPRVRRRGGILFGFGLELEYGSFVVVFVDDRIGGALLGLWGVGWTDGRVEKG